MVQCSTACRLKQRTLTILLVEDEALVRMIMADDFRDAGYDVIECSTGDEAWELLTTGVEIDLLFTDVHMPGGLDGLALAGSAREKLPDLPIIIASGLLPASEAAAFDAFLAKPFPFEIALHRVAGLLDHGRYEA